MNIIIRTCARIGIAAALFAVPDAGAAVCYVQASAGGANSGASWADAYTSLQSALGNAACTETWVAAGTYTPGPARGDSFAIAPGRIVYGGFVGSETARTQANPVANATILSGDIGAPGDASDNSYHVVTLDGTTGAGAISASTVLDGFTVTGGTASGGFPNNMGAGLTCNGNVAGRSCDPTLSRLRFVANTATYGGAVALRADGQGRASPTFSDVVFSGNKASSLGGAIYVWTELNGVVSPTIQRATFTGNLADKGGAIYNASGSQGGTANAIIVNTTFQGNDASLGSSVGNGGAIFNSGNAGSAAPTLTNVTFRGNTAIGLNHFGGAMVNQGSTARPVIANAIFWGDSASNSTTQEFYNVGGGQPTISHSIVAGSGGSGGAWVASFGVDGGGNLDVDPQLGALAANGGFAQTLLPASTSPAIDSGDDGACPATDERGVSRPQGAHCDIGAVEVVMPHVCHVNHAASGANDGFTWASAYVDLQSALHEATCSEVWVAKGVYKPTASSTDQAATFSIRPGLKVHGGFAGGETAAAQADPGANRTVLSGDIDGNDTIDTNGVTRNWSDVHGLNSHGVVLMDATTAAGSIGADTMLDGFAISGGAGIPGLLTTSGAGGLYCDANAAGRTCNPRLSRLWFAGNGAEAGGALLNRGENGGTASPDLRDATFSGNYASQYGAAVFNYGYGGVANPTLSNVTFNGNVGSIAGGVLFNEARLAGQASPTLRSVTFAGNSASMGAAIFVAATDTAVSATTIDSAILADSSGTPEIQYYSSSGSVAISNSVVAEGCAGGQTTCQNVTTASSPLGPLQDNGGATPTLLPGPGSAAVDAGAPTTCGVAPYDFDQRGIARPQGAGCDLGAVELRQTRLTVAVAGPGSVSADAGAPGAAASGIAACRADGGTCSAGYAAEPQPASALLDLAADAHAHLVSVTDNCGVGGAPAGTMSGANYALAAFSADCTVTATFAADTHAVGGTLAGLAGSGLQLRINGGETVTPAAGDATFQFPTALAWGTHYDVAIAAQPTQPWQTCAVANGSGQVGDADVDNIAVTCTTNAYSVGGTVSGLLGSGLALQLGSQNLPINGDGAFTFPLPLESGAAYAVNVATQPGQPTQVCSVAAGSGNVADANVTDVVVTCAAPLPHLVLAIDDDRDHLRYGMVADYVVTLRNDGEGAATDVAVDATVSSAFDGAYAQWQCFGSGAGASCSASGTGVLHDIASVPPGRSLTWRVSVPVRADSQDADATFTIAIGGAQPSSQSDTDALVLFRDGFDVPYGDGTQAIGGDAQALIGGEATRTFALPPSSGERIDTVFWARAASEDVCVQRTPSTATSVLVRLLHRDADGHERVSPWAAARSDATLAIGSASASDGARMWLLEGAAAPLALRVAAHD